MTDEADYFARLEQLLDAKMEVLGERLLSHITRVEAERVHGDNTIEQKLEPLKDMLNRNVGTIAVHASEIAEMRRDLTAAITAIREEVRALFQAHADRAHDPMEARVEDIERWRAEWRSQMRGLVIGVGVGSGVASGSVVAIVTGAAQLFG